MVEVKKYGEEMSKDAKFTVDGGKRTTSYDDLESCVKRVKALRKKGMAIYRIFRWFNGTYEITMRPENDSSFTTNSYGEVHTAGFQTWQKVKSGDGYRIYIRHPNGWADRMVE